MSAGPANTLDPFLLNGVYVLRIILRLVTQVRVLIRRPNGPALTRPITGVTLPNVTRLVRWHGKKPSMLMVCIMLLPQSPLSVRYELHMLENGRRSSSRLTQLAPSPSSEILIDPSARLQLQRLS